MFVEDSYKYIIIMVREAKDKSLFMTAYDPRSATEYMLFGSPAQWMIPDIANESPEKEHIFKVVHGLVNMLTSCRRRTQKLITHSVEQIYSKNSCLNSST